MATIIANRYAIPKNTLMYNMSMFRVLLLNKKNEWVFFWGVGGYTLMKCYNHLERLAFLCLSKSVNRILGMTRVFGQSFQDQKYAQCNR